MVRRKEKIAFFSEKNRDMITVFSFECRTRAWAGATRGGFSSPFFLLKNLAFRPKILFLSLAIAKLAKKE